MTFDDEVMDLARRVVAENRAAGRVIALAESCTGGLTAAAVTAVEGSSDVFDRGFVTYSYEAKSELLGVNAEMIETFGAVSPAVGWAMAQGALTASRADVVVAITGIAGPGGGTDLKPVGMVVFARARRGDDPHAAHVETQQFGNLGRDKVRRAAVVHALELLLPGAKTQSHD